MDWIDAEVIAATQLLFPDPGSALSVAGASGYGIPDEWREPKSDPNEPLLQRLRQLDETLRAHLALLAAQVEEFREVPEDLIRRRGEGISVLISLRELHRRVPELDAPDVLTG